MNKKLTAIQVMIDWAKTNQVDQKIIDKLNAMLKFEQDVLSEFFEAGGNHQGEFILKLEDPKGNIHNNYEYPDFTQYFENNYRQ